MFYLKLIGKKLLIPVWIILVVVGIPVKLVVKMVSIAKSLAMLGLMALAIVTIISYRSWIQVAFLFCLIVSAFLVLYLSVFVDVAIDRARKKIESLLFT